MADGNPQLQEAGTWSLNLTMEHVFAARRVAEIAALNMLIDANDQTSLFSYQITGNVDHATLSAEINGGKTAVQVKAAKSKEEGKEDIATSPAYPDGVDVGHSIWGTGDLTNIHLLKKDAQDIVVETMNSTCPAHPCHFTARNGSGIAIATIVEKMPYNPWVHTYQLSSPSGKILGTVSDVARFGTQEFDGTITINRADNNGQH